MNEVSKKQEMICSPKILKRIGVVALFLLAFGFVLSGMLRSGSMIDCSSDAADIWKTIKTLHTEHPYPSYVLYKGVMSVYPYVWLYHLSVLFGLNEFFFCMCYHSILFAYIAVVAIPSFIRTLTDHTARFWQRIVLVVALIWSWNRYYVLTQLMVDLPSCAFFLASIQCSTHIHDAKGWRLYVLVPITGLLAGICANISGQYVLSGACIVIYALIAIRKRARAVALNVPQKMMLSGVLSLLLFLAFFIPDMLNHWFNMSVVDPLRAAGNWISDGRSWMERGLVYMLDKCRYLYHDFIQDDRGYAILMDYFGPDWGQRIIEMAEAGVYGWTIQQYFSVFFHYPLDFIVMYINRFLVILSDDTGFFSSSVLLIGYTLEYLALLTAITRIRKIKDMFNANTWLVLGVLSSLIPLLVLTVEMRECISFYSLIFGIAIVGPILPEWFRRIKAYFQHDKTTVFQERRIPWAFLGWILFCLFGFGYFGLLGAASELGTAILYH